MSIVSSMRSPVGEALLDESRADDVAAVSLASWPCRSDRACDSRRRQRAASEHEEATDAVRLIYRASRAAWAVVSNARLRVAARRPCRATRDCGGLGPPCPSATTAASRTSAVVVSQRGLLRGAATAALSRLPAARAAERVRGSHAHRPVAGARRAAAVTAATAPARVRLLDGSERGALHGRRRSRRARRAPPSCACGSLRVAEQLDRAGSRTSDDGWPTSATKAGDHRWRRCSRRPSLRPRAAPGSAESRSRGERAERRLAAARQERVSDGARAVRRALTRPTARAAPELRRELRPAPWRDRPRVARGRDPIEQRAHVDVTLGHRQRVVGRVVLRPLPSARAPRRPRLAKAVSPLTSASAMARARWARRDAPARGLRSRARWRRSTPPAASGRRLRTCLRSRRARRPRRRAARARLQGARHLGQLSAGALVLGAGRGRWHRAPASSGRSLASILPRSGRAVGARMRATAHAAAITTGSDSSGTHVALGAITSESFGSSAGSRNAPTASIARALQLRLRGARREGEERRPALLFSMYDSSSMAIRCCESFSSASASSSGFTARSPIRVSSARALSASAASALLRRLHERERQRAVELDQRRR